MSRNKLLILDFDGTLCLGDDPVLTYAAQIDALLAHRGLTANLPRPVHRIVAEALTSNQLLVAEIDYRDDGTPQVIAEELAGENPTDAQEAHPVSWPLQDGYQLTQLLAHQAGLTGSESGAGFLQARRELIAAGLQNTDLHAPAGAVEQLAEIRTHAVVVLITNSPAEGFTPWLETLGLSESFDAVINDARKPFGMPEALDQAHHAADQPISAERVLSIGDIWLNDLAPVHVQGGTTVLIDRFGTDLGTPEHRVASWDQAVPVIRTWAA